MGRLEEGGIEMSNYRPSDDVIAALIQQESGGNPNAISPKGAIGIAQVMPATARDPGYGIAPMKDASNAEQVRFAKDYLGEMVDRTGSLELGLAAYNAGLGAVQKARGIPDNGETPHYVRNIMHTVTHPTGDWQQDEVINEPNGNDPNSWQHDEVVDSPNVQVEASPKNKNGPINSFLQGVGGSVIKAGGGVAEALGAENIAKPMLEEAARAEKDTPGFAGGAGRIVGGAVPYAYMPAKLLASIPAAAAIAGLTTPGDINARLKSAALSGIGTGVLGGVSTAIKGFTPSSEAQALIAKGVQPTVGQGIEQGSILGRSLRRAEEAALSVPIIGAITKSARERAGGEWSSAALKEAEIPALGVSARGKTGHQAIDALKESTSKAYTNVLKDVPVGHKDDIGLSALGFIDDSNRMLSPEIKSSVGAVVARELDNLPANANADQLKTVISTLRNKATSYRTSASASERETGQLLGDTAQHINDLMVSRLPEANAAAYKALDANYGKVKLMEKAASSLGALEGNFTGRQLLNAVRASDKSMGKSTYARGKAILQNEAIQAVKVLGSTMADSGTPERLMTTSLLGGAGVALNPSLLATVPLSMIGATRPAQKALLGGYAKQKIISDALRSLSPALVGTTVSNTR